RVLAQGELPLRHQRLGTGRVEHLPKEARAATCLPELRVSQCLPAFIERRLLHQNLVKKVNGVTVILPRRCVIAFGKQQPQLAREVTGTLLSHALTYAEFALKIQSKTCPWEEPCLAGNNGSISTLS